MRNIAIRICVQITDYQSDPSEWSALDTRSQPPPWATREEPLASRGEDCGTDITDWQNKESIQPLEPDYIQKGHSLKKGYRAHPDRGLDHPHSANVCASTQPQCECVFRKVSRPSRSGHFPFAQALSADRIICPGTDCMYNEKIQTEHSSISYSHMKLNLASQDILIALLLLDNRFTVYYKLDDSGHVQILL
jgi:hypothetical protein